MRSEVALERPASLILPSERSERVGSSRGSIVHVPSTPPPTARVAFGLLWKTSRKENADSFWVHELCAGYSPEVAQEGNEWFNVGSAVRRGRKLACAGCRSRGATVGCFVPTCPRSYHIACAMRTGWDFEADDQGKFFYRFINTNDISSVAHVIFKENTL